MAFHQILSTAELQIAPDGLYYVAGDDGSYIESDKDGTPVRLMARVRDEEALPKGAQGVIVRADGKQIITEWVNANLVEAVIAEPAVEERPSGPPLHVEQGGSEYAKCPLCQAPLSNRVIHAVTVCPGCGSSIALVGGTAIKATSTHTLSLTPEEIKLLKSDRPKVRA